MNAFQAKYAPLFTISVQQLYYLNNLYKDGARIVQPDFELVPTPDCLRTMKRLDHVARAGNPAAGLTVLGRVLGKTLGGDDLLRFKPAAGDKLSFYLMLRNSQAINYNILPLTMNAGRIYYFNNLVGDGAALRNNLHLSLAAAGVHETNDATRENASSYSYTHGAPVAAGTAFVHHLATGAKIEPVSLVNDGGKARLSFRLEQLPAGKCELRIAGPVQDSFYYNGSALLSGAWGVVEIFLSNTLAAHYQVVEADYSLLPDRPVFALRFENRPVKWRYTVKLPENSALYKEIDAIALPADKTNFINRINIVTNDAAIVFTLSPPVAGTPKELVFVSNAVVGFKEKYFSSTLVNKPLKLDLKKNIGLGPPPPIVKANLPHPGAGLINAQSLPDIFSEIFITI